MTDPRTPDDSTVEPTVPSPTPDVAATTDSPTQAWPSVTAPMPSAPPATSPFEASPAATTPIGAPIQASSPFEPAPSLPSSAVLPVSETGPSGAQPEARRGRSKLRWGLALVAVLVVVVASVVVVSLAGGKPATSTALGYMSADTMVYEEIRLDLPGDQRTKLATFLKPFPGFADQSQIDVKLDELLDKLVKAGTSDKETWTTDIKPWFGGQLAAGAAVPAPTSGGATMTSSMNGSLVVATVTDRAKAIAWLMSTLDPASVSRTTYGDADLLTPADNAGGFAVAVNDKVMLAGTTVAVKAAIDTGGKGALAGTDDMKAALATLDQDYVVLTVTRLHAYAQAALQTIGAAQASALANTQLDDTALAMLPAWQVTTARFENDAIVASSVGPSWSIGYDAINRPSDVLGHVPAKSVLYYDIHDVGPSLTAVLAKFRAIDEPAVKNAFAQVDQALGLLGGSDAVFGWWGDTAVVVTPLDDGTIGGGLVIHPRDAAAADRFTAAIDSFLALGAGSTGAAVRTEDHNGTKITIVDLSGMPSMSTTKLPPGYKAEFAWATNKDVAVFGYGANFVKAVLDAGPGNSLADDARFKGLLDRVGADNMGVAFLDVSAIRALVEPLMQANLPADQWTKYTTDIQPYLKPIDAMISANRKDGSLDRSTGAFTAH
jgi:hypothetical protein